MTLIRCARRLFALVILTGCTGCAETPTSPTSTVPDASASPLASQIGPRGTAARMFTVAAAGTVSVTLSSTNPAGVVVGLGIGIPRGNNSGCSLTQSVETTAGPSPQITATVATGAYCAQVFDLGTLTEPLGFTLSIAFP